MSAGHPSRKTYVYIFLALLILTALEVGVVYVPDINKTLLVVALVGMALTKAGLVALFFMHLKYETRALRWTVAVPMCTPGFYALILIAEAAWRYLA